MSILVVVLSLGLDISKMKCDEGGTIYLGSEVPSCNLQEEVVCESKLEVVSCCVVEVQKPCCPEQKDNTCSSETKNIQFNFETLVSVYDFSFEEKIILLDKISVSFFSSTKEVMNIYASCIPPPQLNKPVLSKIQSFLL